MKSKILSSQFKNKYEKDGNVTFYHQLHLEGVDKYVSIGAKTEETPEFLQAGKELEYEWKDEAKGSIKRVQAAFGGKGGKFIDQSNTQFIIAAMNNATALKIAGVIPEGETISSMIQRFTEHAVQLKKELV